MRLLLLWVIEAGLAWALGSMHPKTYEALQQIEAALSQKAYEKAQAIFVERFENVSPKRTYDLAFLHHTYGYFWVQKGEYEKAVVEMQKALDYGVFDDTMTHATHLTLAQLTLSIGRASEALAWLDAWHKAEQPNETTAQLAMYSHIALENYPAAYTWAQTMIEASAKPEASMYETKLALELQLEKNSQAIATLVWLIEHFAHKTEYYQQLAMLYAKQGDVKEASGVLESAYVAGLIQAPEAMELLAYYFYDQGALDKSRTLMQKVYEANTTNANAEAFYLQILLASKEHDAALALLESTYAARPDPKKAELLAQLFAARFDWEKVAFYAKEVRVPDVQVLYGMALFYLKQPNAAVRVFQSVKAESPKDSAVHQNAQAWLRHIGGV